MQKRQCSHEHNILYIVSSKDKLMKKIFCMVAFLCSCVLNIVAGMPPKTDSMQELEGIEEGVAGSPTSITTAFMGYKSKFRTVSPVDSGRCPVSPVKHGKCPVSPVKDDRPVSPVR